MSDLLQVSDLEKAKLHDTFHSEVITGKEGGLAGGADIDFTTNAVTGQVQATLPKLLSQVGFAPVDFDFTTGGILTNRSQSIFYEADGNWYSWDGALPKTVAPLSSPSSTGGIAVNAWNISTSAFMYRDYEGFKDELYHQADIIDNGLPNQLGDSQIVDALNILFNKNMSVESYGIVGDGITVNDAAMVTLASIGGEFVFDRKDGVYLFENAYISGAKNITLSCRNGAKIKRKSGVYGTNPDGAISGMIDFVNCSKINLVEMNVDCNRSGAIPSGGSHLNGINFYKCHNVSTAYSNFSNAEFQALNHQNCNDVRAYSNNIHDCGWSGIGVTGGYFNEYGAERAWVVGNTFKNIWAGVQSQVSMRYLTVEDNKFINSSIILAQDIVFGSISRNQIDGPAPSGALGEVPQDGIFMESCSNIDIHDNIINNSARFGVLVVGNYISNGPREGVLICDNVSVRGNNILNCPQGGISFSPGSQYTYNLATHTPTLETDESLWTQAGNCEVFENSVVSSGGVGIGVSVLKNSKVYNNSSSLNLLSGMEIGNCSTLSIFNNDIYNNSQSGADLHDGIKVRATSALVDGLTIYRNRIYDNQTVRKQAYGVNNQNIACTNFRMWGNTFERNGNDYICVVDYLPFLVVSPTLLNGSSSFGSGFSAPSYYKDANNIVHLRGVVQLGASSVNAILFNLRENYRPKVDEMFVTISNQQIARVDVRANGDVFVSLGQNSQWLSLSGISFAIGG